MYFVLHSFIKNRKKSKTRLDSHEILLLIVTTTTERRTREQLKNRVHKKVQPSWIILFLFYGRDHTISLSLSCPLSVKNTRPIVFPSKIEEEEAAASMTSYFFFWLKGNCCDIRAGVVPLLDFWLCLSSLKYELHKKGKTRWTAFYDTLDFLF